LAAAPTVAEFTALLAASKGKGNCEFLRDFRAAETMMVREGVFMAMTATCRSLDLWPAGAVGIDPEDITYHDTSEPLEHIAQRLFNFVKCRAATDEEELHQQRMLAASFVVEFGREHGLPPGPPDAAAERMLMEFLEKVKAWGERSGKRDLTPCLESLSPSLKKQAENWWKANWRGVVLGAGLLAAGAVLVGMGLTLVAASSKKEERKQKNGEDLNRNRLERPP